MSKPVIFVIDDDAPIREALEGLIRSIQFDVETFGTTEEFLKFKRPDAPGCIILDVRLPGLNGLDLARQIRRSYPTVRVVLSSAYHLSARQVERADCGAIGFVPKPYRLAELCSFLRAKTKAVSPSAC